ncbi:MAG: thermonuclease family protein [Candidatus Thiodiazotropha sp. (ex Notomyrtea botanica)]|nr:thermonuclease family protein [Candidatus Thiodiazotropha sp. (ex Notomyrtea botanica)]
MVQIFLAGLNSKKRIPYLVLLVAVLVIPENLFASGLSGQVVGIPNGTEIILLANDERRLRVTLAGIQVPPLARQGATITKRHLHTLLAGRFVTVEPIIHSPAGVILGRVLYGGSDIGLRLIQSGLAQLTDAPTHIGPELLTRYRRAEQEARSRKMGYWQDIR